MEAIVTLLQHDAVLIVLVMTFLARMGVPVPAAPLLVIAGGLVTTGLSLPAAIFAASVVGNAAGDAAWFLAGRRYGRRMMRLLCRISLSPDSCVAQSESLIVRWGGSSLIAAKFIPGVSVVAAPMTGALGMTWRTFLAFEAVAAALWTLVFLLLGVLFHNQIRRVLDVLSSTGGIALVALAVVLAGIIAMRFWRRHRLLVALQTPRISVDELRSLLLGDSAPVIVDIRPASSLQIDDRMLPGALHLPLEEIGAHGASLPRDRDIVVYCNCPNEVSAAVAVRKLRDEHGIGRVRALRGGLDAWFADEQQAPDPDETERAAPSASMRA
ncbi:MAG TPA: DedA family protein/thiosulfate sulfurtransferase GlpE [Burkholderiaceae bacterium]|nr:DedA family protein/thiosulfate sulfurtransferase GlpE [Burkholderiaceae bacterium]